MYNRHNSEKRPWDGDKVNDKMFVAWNGPQIGEADEKLKKALYVHFADNFKTCSLVFSRRHFDVSTI